MWREHEGARWNGASIGRPHGVAELQSATLLLSMRQSLRGLEQEFLGPKKGEHV